MSSNPYEDKPSGGEFDPNIQSAVNGPAVALLVSGILNVLFALYLIVNGATTMMMGDAVQEMQKQQLQDQGMDPAQMEQMENFLELGTKWGSGINIGFGVLGLLIGIFVIMASLNMKKLQGHKNAFIASILSIIPCTQPCCLIGIPIGIWCLVTLNKPEVKAAFSD